MDKQSEPLDVLLIGGGIMSATLGPLIAKTMPNKSTALVERLDDLAGESSGSWNNAGTGHAGLCELNYMPDADDSSKPEVIANQFALTRDFWAALIESGSVLIVPPSTFQSGVASRLAISTIGPAFT